MFCTKCGKELKPGAKFCNGCGAPVNKTNAEEEKQVQNEGVKVQSTAGESADKHTANSVQSTPPKNGKKRLFIILGIVAAVIVVTIIIVAVLFRNAASDKDIQETYNELQKENSLKDAYDVAGMTEEEFLEKTGIQKNEFGSYPNEDETVFLFVDGKLMGITLFEGQGEEYSFKGMSVGDAFPDSIAGFSKIEYPGSEGVNVHGYRDDNYPNYMLSIKCNEDGTIHSIGYMYIEDEEWQSMLADLDEFNEQNVDNEGMNIDTSDTDIVQSNNTIAYASYDDAYSTRCHMIISPIEDSNQCSIFITWGNSADSAEYWSLTGDYEGDRIPYSGVQWTGVYTENGEMIESKHNVSGYFSIDDSDIVRWSENPDCMFEMMGEPLDSDSYVRVTAPDGYVNVREGAGTQYPVNMEIPTGALLNVTSYGGDWTGISFLYGSGYVANSQVEPYTGSSGPENTTANSSEFILPEADSRYYSSDELKGLSKDELRIARNEILARHGRIFDSEDLNSYFSSKSWYQGTYTAEEFDAHMNDILNSYEKANIETIKEMEK